MPGWLGRRGDQGAPGTLRSPESEDRWAPQQLRRGNCRRLRHRSCEPSGATRSPHASPASIAPLSRVPGEAPFTGLARMGPATEPLGEENALPGDLAGTSQLFPRLLGRRSGRAAKGRAGGFQGRSGDHAVYRELGKAQTGSWGGSGLQVQNRARAQERLGQTPQPLPSGCPAG